MKAAFLGPWPTPAALRQACTLANVCRLFALLLVAWQPFPGEYRVPLVGSALLGLVLSLRGALPAMAEPARRLGLLLLCLVIPGLLSIPTSLAPGKSWGEIVSVALVALAGISVLYGLRTRADHQWLQTGLVVVIAAWIGDGLLQAFTGADVFGIVPPEGFITGPFKNNATFGIIITILLPLTFWEPLKQRRPEALALLTGTLLVITLSGQRNNLLLAVIGLYCLSALWKPRTRLVAIGCFIALLIAATHLSPALQERGGMMIESINSLTFKLKTSRTDSTSPLNKKDILSKINTFSNDRGYLIEAGFKMIRVNPLTGIGIGGYKKAYPQFTSESPPRKDIHAHNIYLGIAAETGFAGIGFFSYFLYLLWSWYSSAPPSRKAMAAPYAYTLIVILFPLASHTSLFRAFHFTIFLLILSGFLSALFSSAETGSDLANTSPKIIFKLQAPKSRRWVCRLWRRNLAWRRSSRPS